MLGSNFAFRFVIASLATVSLSLAVAGCGSSSDNTPADAGTTTCDLTAVESMIFTPKCATGGCHDGSTNTAAGLNLVASATLASRLVGVTAGTGTGTLCGGASRVYLTAGSNPATGLLIDKVSSNAPPCGLRMPLGGTPLTTTEIACLKSWATSATTAP